MRLASISNVAAVVRGRRAELRLSQDELASRSGVSRKWVVQLEAGKATAEMGLVLRVFDALGLAIEVTTEIKPAGTGGDALDAIIEEHRRG
jgi:HTH-type transcriptional regulator/antitoxin HipB